MSLCALPAEAKLEAGGLLKLPQFTVVSAAAMLRPQFEEGVLCLLAEIRTSCDACNFIVRFQRFYFCKSFAEYDVPILEKSGEGPVVGSCWRSVQVRSLAAAALVLASKPPCGVWGETETAWCWGSFNCRSGDLSC